MKALLHKPLRLIYIGGFLFNLHIALTTYVNSTFLGTFVQEDTIGILFTLGSLLTIIILANASRILNLIGNKRAMILATFINVVSLVFMLIGTLPWMVAVAFITYLASSSLVFFSIDIFVERHTRDGSTGNARGLFLGILNLAWIFSPLIAGQLIDHVGFGIVYVIGLVMTLVVMGMYGGKWNKFVDPRYTKASFWKAMKKFLRNKNLRRILASNFILYFFYAWMVIYMPIYLNQHIGFDWATIGVIFTVMLMPFVIFEFPLGRLADKYFGEKEILTAGLIVMGVSCLAIGFVTSTSPALWALLLFVSRMGAAAVEIMTESYFFKQVDAEDINQIGIFRDTRPLAYMIGPLLATVLLVFLDLQAIFIALAIIVFLGLWFSLRLKDTK